MRYLARDGTFKDAVSGSIMNLAEAAEGDLWVTTENGSRFPAAYRDSAEGRGHKWSARKQLRDERAVPRQPTTES